MKKQMHPTTLTYRYLKSNKTESYKNLINPLKLKNVEEGVCAEDD